MTVTTNEFASTPGAFVMRVMALWFERWWWAVLLPVAVCLALTAIDAVWFFVVLMIVCLLYPALLSFIYFNYALSPEARDTVLPHTITLSDTEITVNYKGKNNFRRFSKGDIRSIEQKDKSVIINLRQSHYAHLWIPRSAIPESAGDTFSDILDSLTPPVA